MAQFFAREEMTRQNEPNELGVNRILPRYAYEARIRIGLLRSGDNRFVGGWARDLSESGVGAFVAEEMYLGEEVSLELLLGELKAKIPSRITRVLGTQYGFQFIALSAEQRHAIRVAVRGKEPLPIPR